jgi:hypothetical protein
MRPEYRLGARRTCVPLSPPLPTPSSPGSVNDGRWFQTYGLLAISTLFTIVITVFTFGIKVQ